MTAYSPAVVEVARHAGIDLVEGRHEPTVAEAARRARLELLRFPEWTWAEMLALRTQLAALAAEEALVVDLMTAVAQEMRDRGVTVIGGVPAERLAEILGCPVGDVWAVLERLGTRPWWTDPTWDGAR